MEHNVLDKSQLLAPGIKRGFKEIGFLVIFICCLKYCGTSYFAHSLRIIYVNFHQIAVSV